jgi:hypothetical protein
VWGGAGQPRGLKSRYDEEEAYDGGNKDSDIRHDSEERSDRIDKSPQPRATHPYTGSIKKTRVGEDVTPSTTESLQWSEDHALG